MRANYGIDAPGLVRAFLFVGIGLFSLIGLAFEFEAGRSWTPWLGIVLFVPAIYALGMCCLMLWESLVAKVRDRDVILDLVEWTGGENVLDVGCGRGLMLVGAARRLTTGRATGVDIWAGKDQSSNDKSAPAENARIEGVSDRVTIETADMRKLPYADLQFDVVVSSWAVHNLESESDREQAIAEMVRVLRPNGVILLTDIVHRNDYVTAFKGLGFEDVRLIVLSPMKDRLLTMVSFGAFQPATVVARRKLSR